MDDQELTPGFVADVFHRAFAPEAFWIEAGCVALVLYEYLLTIRAEAKVVWGRKLTVPTVLYYINRYTLLLLGLAIALWGFVEWTSDSSCIAPGALQKICCALIQACYTIFSALRIHAINNRNWTWTILILCLGCVGVPPLVVGIVAARRVIAVGPPPLRGCAAAVWTWDGLDAPAWSRVAIAAECCTILMDTVVLAITWYRTAGILIMARKIQLQTSLASLMLRDGTTFFSLALALHIIVIVVDETRQTSLVLITCTFMSIIMSRFILNLRTLESSDPETRLYTLHLTKSTSIRFSSSVLDNVGAPIDVDARIEDDYLDDHHYNYDDNSDLDSIHEELVPMRRANTLSEYAPVPDAELHEC
ncbi:hypothetical protein C8Q77DRAFT_1119605 [Trametes polyzona]|nr:hypothetical protein C8Q77DRAFT_1119605 [Trametes polyzona]